MQPSVRSTCKLAGSRWGHNNIVNVEPAPNRWQAAWTALHLASENGHVDVVKALLGAGATVNATTKVPPKAFELWNCTARVSGHAVMQRSICHG